MPMKVACTPSWPSRVGALHVRQFVRARWPSVCSVSHADRERPDQREVAVAVDREALPIDARFQRAVHGLQKVVAVRLDVEADQVGAQQAVEQFALPRADAEGLRIRPGDVPEDGDARIRALAP